MSTTTIDTSKWAVTTEPPPVRRNPATQAAFEYFYFMATGASALIPKDEASIARNAAAQLKKESEDSIQIRFRDEGETVRATKIKGQSAGDLATAIAERDAKAAV